MVSKAPDRLFGFADLVIKDSYGMYEGAEELEYAIKDLGLRGLKIHPSNLNIKYFDILDQMDFTQDEINQITYKNISNILKNED